MNERENAKAVGGIAPFGYRWQDGHLVIDEHEAPVRKLIYELFLKHRRKKTVARLLNDLGYRTRKEATFYDITIVRLLRDPTAKGTWLVNGREVAVEAIVSEDVWERANRILLGAKPAKQPVQLFSGLAYCECGGRMLVPSNSEKCVCIDCRHKIPVDDLEVIFHSQLVAYRATESEGLYEHWYHFNQKEKRILIEQICERIIVGRNTIQVEFSYLPQAADVATSVDDRKPVDACETTEDNKLVTSLDEPLLSETAAAKLLGVSKITLLRKRNAGEIGYFPVGSRPRYSKEKHLLPFLIEREKKKSGGT